MPGPIYFGGSGVVSEGSLTIGAFGAITEMPANLTELHLTSSNVEVPSLAGLAKLKILEVTDTPISQAPDFTGAPNLEEISLNGTSINGGGHGSDPIDVSSLAHLKSLSCNNNNSLTVPPITTGLASLEEYILAGSAITSPPDVSDLTGLKRFNVSVTTSMVDAPSLVGPVTLEEFTCFSNAAMELPPDVSVQLGLTKLICNSNSAMVAFPDVSQLENLVELHCLANPLITDPPDVSNSPDLEILHCTENAALTDIPGISANPLLRIIGCSGNSLVTVFPSVSGRPLLERLECGNVGMTGTLPSVAGCSALEYYQGNGTSCTGAPDFSSCTSLTEVILMDGALTESAIDSVLSQLVALGALNGTCELRNSPIDGGTNSAPSAAGLIDKATLESRGWIVNVET